MARNHDYIPSNDDAALTFAKTLCSYALANHARWGAPTPQGILDAPVAAFETALAAFKNPNHGRVDTLAKNEAKTALVRALRTYVQAWIARNPAVTDDDRERMGLPIRDTIPTPHPVPDIKPEIEAEPAGKGRHTVTAMNPLTRNRQKPEYVAAVAFAHRVRNADEPKARAEDMPSEVQTGAMRDFLWGEELYGKVCDYACAYEGDARQRGPWSDVTSLIIN